MKDRREPRREERRENQSPLNLRIADEKKRGLLVFLSPFHYCFN